jgi:hypothetical protein
MSTATKPERRKLTFATLDDAVCDADNLLASGYERAGQWDLTQCCHHLAVLMTYPIDGFPRFRFPMNVGVWLLKQTVARRWLRKVLESGVWPTGTPTDKRTVPPAGGNDAEAAAELKRAVERLLTHTGPLQPSPLFGMLDKETLVKLHRIHTAHHLSFLVPKPAGGRHPAEESERIGSTRSGRANHDHPAPA